MSKLPQDAKMDRETSEEKWGFVSPTLELLSAEAYVRYAERDFEAGRDFDEWLDAEARTRQGHDSEW